MHINEILGKKIIVFDGGMGTQLQAAGLEVGEYPDSWNIEHGEDVKNIHKKYLNAGSDIVTTNTFGSNSLNSGSSKYSVNELISAAVKNGKEAIREVDEERRQRGLPERQFFTALDIGPTGELMDLIGALDFDGAYEIFKEQVVAGTNAGADFIIFETFSDIAELKAGIIAAKENSDLPIFCTMTFQDDGRMLMGTTPETAILALQNMGVEAIGMNCSLGPKEMIPIISRIVKTAKIPVIAQPNAGLPRMKNGVATYDISEDEFANYVLSILKEGASVVGGCCGTTPSYIEKLCEIIEKNNISPPVVNKSDSDGKTKSDCKYAKDEDSSKECYVACTTTKHVLVGDDLKLMDYSFDEEELRSDIESADYEEVVSLAQDIIKEGASIVAFNMEFTGENEREILKNIVHEVSLNGNIPIAICGSSAEIIEDAVRYCRGLPIIISSSKADEEMHKIKTMASKYGADIVCIEDKIGTIAGLQ